MRHLLKACARKAIAAYYQPGKTYRIPFGPIRGLKMVYDPLVQYRFMLGLYDNTYLTASFRCLQELKRLSPGFTSIDAGANAGYFTLWLAHITDQAGGGAVYSFEALARNAKVIEASVRANQFSRTRVAIENCAIADSVGTVRFFEGSCNLNGSVLQDWAIASREESVTVAMEVRSTTLDAFTEGLDRLDFLKIDIEGAGEIALAHMTKSFAKHRPIALMESHTAEEDYAIGRFLQSHEYSAFRMNNLRWVASLTDCYKNPEGIWGTMLFIPNEVREQTTGVLSAGV